MKASEVLRKAKSLIDKPEKWLRDPACRASGCRLCAHGAVAMAESGDAWKVHDSLLGRYLARAAYGEESMLYGIAPWNDAPERTHAEVMQAFDRAIELAEKEEGKPTDAEITAKFIADMTEAVAKNEVIECATAE